MFAKEKDNILQSHSLRNYESIDALHGSDSAKDLGNKKKIKSRSESLELDRMKQRLRTDEIKTSKQTELSGESASRAEIIKPTSHF
jgi:hypothetical protein